MAIISGTKSSFPSSIDVLVEKVNGVDDVDANHVNRLMDMVFELETKVGADSSGISTSHDYLLARLESLHTAGRIMLFGNASAPDGWTK